MSFILDALKKSELERQRQNVPGLMDTHMAPRRSRLPVWAIALIALLAINLLALTFVLMRRSGPAAPAPHAQTSPAVEGAAPGGAAPESANVATPHFSPLDAAPVYAPEIPLPAVETAAEPPTAARAAPPSGSVKSAAKPMHRPDPLLSDANANADTEEVLPTINEISLTGTQTLPELHLDVHVYATDPADRFVYINMRKYHEGGALQEGPIVERIRRNGVVLKFQGLRFLLPRQP